MPAILVLATSRRTHGGIASVMRAYEQTPTWKRCRCKWIATHRSGSKALKVIYMLMGLMVYSFYLPWAQIVHVNVGELPSAKRKLIFVRMARLLGKKVIVHAHVYDDAATADDEKRRVYARLFNSAELVLVLSEISRRNLSSTFNVGEKIRVLYNPCPALPDYGNDDVPKRKMILAAGVITPAKGYRDLIKAFAKAAPDNPEWKLVFAGSGEIDEAMALCHRCGIEDRVEFPGWVSGSEKDRLFRQASILCHASYAEGFPMAVLEAWAYGLPVVATPVGGIPDKVTHGRDIILFIPGDVNALAANLSAMMSGSSLRHIIADGSRRFATNDFNISAIGRRLGEIYDELL